MTRYTSFPIQSFILDSFSLRFQVSWLKRLSPQHVPDLLTFGETIYVKDARISIKRQIQESSSKEKMDEDWMLQILHSKIPDSGLYMCQVSTEPPQIHNIYLSVEGTYSS